LSHLTATSDVIIADVVELFLILAFDWVALTVNYSIL